MEKQKNQRLSSAITSDAISISNETETIEYQKTIYVHRDIKEDVATISEKDLAIIRKLCNKAKEKRFPWSEFFMGLFTLFLGTLLGGIPYEITLINFIIVPVYSVLVGLGFAGYMITRKNQYHKLSEFGEEILDHLPEEKNDNNKATQGADDNN